MERILIVGAGAVGGFFGARLHAAGRNVTFLVRAARAAQLRRDGIRLLGPEEELTVRPAIVTADALHDAFDLVLIGTKSYGLAAAIEDVAPAVGPRTTVLPLLNGLAHLDMLGARFGADAVLGGFCFVSADLEADGRIRVFNAWQELRIGALRSAQVERSRDAAALLDGAGFDLMRSDSILADMWAKWVQIASAAALNVLVRGPVGAAVAVPHGVELARALVAEAAFVAESAGFRPTAALLSEHEARLTTPGSPLSASMFRDMARGGPVEADALIGDLLRRGVAAGVATPSLRAAYVGLAAYEAARTHAA